MGLKELIIPYIQGDGLIAPSIVIPPNTFRTCDNGLMFSSEYYIMLNRNKLICADDIARYFRLIRLCIGADKHLHRSPNDLSKDEIDDYLGVLAGYAEFNFIVNFNLPLSLCRFPQLIYAWLLSKNIPSLLIFPLTLITAAIIAASCINTAKSDADSRRLNWDLWQATKRKSILCNLAGIFWHWRQKKVYNTNNVMQAVAATYYQSGHPFITYWID